MTRDFKHMVIRSNKRERTITIGVFVNGILQSKYKTNVLDKEEFNCMKCHYTSNDLFAFLRYSGNYYAI